MHKHNIMLPVWEYQTKICARWRSTTPTTRRTTLGKMKEQIPHEPPTPAKPPPARPWQKESKQLPEPQHLPRLPVVLNTQGPPQQLVPPRPPQVRPGGRGQGRPPSFGAPLGARGESARKLFVFGSGQLPAHQAKEEEPFDIGAGQVFPHGPTLQQVLPRLPHINPGVRGGGQGNLFVFGTTRPLGSSTSGEAVTVMCDTPLCNVTVRDPEGGETLYKIKRHENGGDIHSPRQSEINDPRFPAVPS